MFTFFIVTSCVKEADLAFPKVPSQPVLNGIISPNDSLLCITITYSSSLDDTAQHFTPIEDATVLLYEDQKPVDSLIYHRGKYVSDFRPKVNKQYTIEATINGYGIVKASDVVPPPPVVSACYKEATFLDNGLRYVGTQVDIQDYVDSEDFYWLNMSVTHYRLLDFGESYCEGEGLQRICTYYDSSDVVTEQLSTLVSVSTVPDNFNSIVDNTSGGIREFDTFIRVEDQAINGTDIAMDISSYSPLYNFDEMSQLDGNQSVIVETTNASQHYDRYLKSSMIYYFNNQVDNDEDLNPFAEPTRIYSNVENGLGIFAAYNSVRIAVEDFPCP